MGKIGREIYKRTHDRIYVNEDYIYEKFQEPRFRDWTDQQKIKYLEKIVGRKPRSSKSVFPGLGSGTHGEVYRVLADLYKKVKNYKKAAEMCNRCELYIEAGELLELAGDSEGAALMYERNALNSRRELTHLREDRDKWDIDRKEREIVKSYSRAARALEKGHFYGKAAEYYREANNIKDAERMEARIEGYHAGRREGIRHGVRAGIGHGVKKTLESLFRHNLNTIIGFAGIVVGLILLIQNSVNIIGYSILNLNNISNNYTSVLSIALIAIGVWFLRK